MLIINYSLQNSIIYTNTQSGVWTPDGPGSDGQEIDYEY